MNSVVSHHTQRNSAVHLPDVFSRIMLWLTFLSALQIGGGQNFHEVLLKVVEMVIRESRDVRVQPFNEYRKKFGLKPYTSFYEFTGEQKK